MADEPLYQYLRQQLPQELLHIYEDGKVPNLEDYKTFQGQVLFIADDLVNEKKAQTPLQEWWLRGRKACGGVSMCYLTQSYFKCPKFIRINSQYIFLKKLSSIKDLNLILRDYDTGMSRDALMGMYDYSTDDGGTLLIDCEAPLRERFRKNFLEILDPKDYEPLREKKSLIKKNK